MERIAALEIAALERMPKEQASPTKSASCFGRAYAVRSTYSFVVSARSAEKIARSAEKIAIVGVYRMTKISLKSIADIAVSMAMAARTKAP